MIQMFMLLAGALIIMLSPRPTPSQIGKNEVFRAGMIAVVAVFGIAWMADTVFDGHTCRR
ncbi:MAG: hypothetical protein MZW92_18450 [Comamonadaceae bacterium]|nr:hypothetical protein [Comamonadaceae bacterium]